MSQNDLHEHTTLGHSQSLWKLPTTARLTYWLEASWRALDANSLDLVLVLYIYSGLQDQVHTDSTNLEALL